MIEIADFAGYAVALYAAHHAGDYWVQSDRQAAKKGCAGHEGRMACLGHVATYTATQAAFVGIVVAVTDVNANVWSILAALLFSAVTHYAADRREFGIMFRLARMIPGKANFLRLGVPRAGHYDDNPSLGTGGWALDQAWHIVLGVFVSGLIAAI